MTTVSPHGIKAGDWVSFEVRDTRWWMRLVYKLLRKGEPRQTIRRRVSQATTTTLTF